MSPLEQSKMEQVQRASRATESSRTGVNVVYFERSMGGGSSEDRMKKVKETKDEKVKAETSQKVCIIDVFLRGEMGRERGGAPVCTCA